MADVLFVGYFGFGNLGDQLILSAVTDALRRGRPELELAALCGSEVTAWPEGVAQVARGDSEAVRAALGEARVLVVGPGGIFQDATSWRSPLWYAWMCSKARAGGASVVHIGQSVGPLRRRVARLATRHALRGSRAIVVRDQGSARLCGELGVRESVEIAADAGWLLPDREGAASARPRAVALAPRPWAASPSARAAWWAGLARELLDAGWEVRGLAMSAMDMRLLQEAVRLTGRKWTLAHPPDARGALDLLSSCQAVIGMRLHSLVLGALAGARLLGVSYDPKVDGLLGALGLEPAGWIETHPRPDHFRELLAQHHWGHVAPERVQALRERAKRNVEAVIEAADATGKAR